MQEQALLDHAQQIGALKSEVAHMTDRIEDMDKKLDQIIAAANMGKGAWLAAVKAGGILATLGAGAAWGMPTNMHSSVMTYVNSGRFPGIRVGATDAEVGVSTAGCANHENPGFQPSGVATLAGGQIAPIQPPNDGFFEPVTFIGAVAPVPADNWMTGWTAFPQR